MIKKCILVLLIFSALGVTTAFAEDFPYPISNIVSVEITNTTEFIFTPDVTGYWVFRTSDNENYDPRLWLRNMYGVLIAEDDDSGGDLNALMTVHLVGGVDYLLEAGFWRGNTGQYMLSVYLVDRFVRLPSPEGSWDWGNWDWGSIWVPITIPGQGSSFNSANFRQTAYFTPDTTGLWAFEISGFIGIRIYDPLGNRLLLMSALGIESGTVFTMHLVEGVPYRIEIDSAVGVGYELMTATIFYSENAYPLFSIEELRERGLDFEGELVPLQVGLQDLQGSELFSFIPAESGFWRFEITDFSGSDWEPYLNVSDRRANFVADIWIQWHNAGHEIIVYLAEGFEYVLFVWDKNLSNQEWLYQGNFTLSITQYDFEIPHPADIIIEAQPHPIPLPPPLLPTPALAPVLSQAYVIIPPTGGQQEMFGESEYTLLSFTPAATGTWVIEAGSDATNFTIRDGSGSFAITSRWGGVTINLAAGVEYFIEVDTWGHNCVLFVSPYYQIHHFVPGMEVERVVLRETDFSFIPTVSGVWLIETLSFRVVDPYLWLLDASGNIIAHDDDSGSGLDALIKIELAAGDEYTIRAGFLAGSVGRYTLRVSMLNMVEPELPRLPSPLIG